MAYTKSNRSADSSVFIEAALRQDKDKAQEALEKQWRERRPGEEVPRVDHLLAYMADDLEFSRELMIDSMQEHLNETSSIGVPRDERQGVVKDMRYWYRFIRDHCVNTYGELEAQRMGFDLTTENQPWRLARQTKRVINKCTKMDPEERILPKEEMKKKTALSAGDVVEVLEPPYKRLKSVLSTVVLESKQVESALIRKDRDYDAYEKKATRYAAAGKASLRLVDMDEEASRITPTVRRPGTREEVIALLEGTTESDSG